MLLMLQCLHVVTLTVFMQQHAPEKYPVMKGLQSIQDDVKTS